MKLKLTIFAALLACGCGTWAPNGSLFGVKVSTLEKPLNAGGAALGSPIPVGSVALAADNFAVQTWGKKEQQFPLTGVITSRYDAVGTKVILPIRTVLEPIYGTVTNVESLTSVKPDPIVITPEAAQGIFRAIQESRGNVLLIPSATKPTTQTNAAPGNPQAELEQLLDTVVVDGSEPK